MTEYLRYIPLVLTLVALIVVIYLWFRAGSKERGCAATDHEWNRDFREIDLSTTVFMRVDCVKCGAAIDGTKAKRVYDATGITFGRFVEHG